MRFVVSWDSLSHNRFVVLDSLSYEFRRVMFDSLSEICFVVLDLSGSLAFNLISDVRWGFSCLICYQMFDSLS